MRDDSKTPPGRKQSRKTRENTPALSDAHATKPTPEQLEQRWADAIELGRLHELECTGIPGEAECHEPAAIIVVLHVRMLGLPCRAHAGPLVTAIISAGHASVRTEPLADHVSNPLFLKSAAFIRDQNRENGVRIPDANPHSTSKKPKTGLKSR